MDRLPRKPVMFHHLLVVLLLLYPCLQRVDTEDVYKDGCFAPLFLDVLQGMHHKTIYFAGFSVVGEKAFNAWLI